MAKKKKTSETIAIVALIFNLVAPGLGTIIAGRNNPGVIQLVLFLIGIPLSILLIGVPLVIATWIWALVSSIKIVQESGK